MKASEARVRTKQAKDENHAEMQETAESLLGTIYERIQTQCDRAQTNVTVRFTELGSVGGGLAKAGDRYYRGVVYRVLDRLLKDGYHVSTPGANGYNRVFDLKDYGWMGKIAYIYITWNED